jgi:predicted porin
MNKRLSVLALASLTAPTAFAQGGSNVQIYGTLLPFFDNVKTEDATSPAPADRATQVPAAAFTGVNQPSRNRLTSNTSNIGFRGSEELGNGLKAIFQVESAAPVADGGPPAGTFANRNSNVGLQGPWGIVFYGIWDTPYKFTTLALVPVRGINPFDYDNILENPGFNVPVTTTQSGRINAAADAAFSRREGNSVHYWTPLLKGFSARVSYSANEGKSSSPPPAGQAEINPYIWSLALSYENGPLTLRYAYERHNDYFGMAQLGGSPGATPTNDGSDDDGNKLSVFYNFGNTKIGASYERLKYEADDSLAGAVDEYKRDAYFLIAQHRFGNNGIWASYGRAEDGDCSRVGGAACSTNGLSAKLWTLGYVYSFSKRTDVYAAYFEVDNDRSAQYGVGFFQPVAPGADTRGIGLGILHSF